MVFNSFGDISYGRIASLWKHLHWDVFCFHVFLELQGTFFPIRLIVYCLCNFFHCSFLTPSCDLQVYYVYGFMLLVFLILIIVTVCVTIVGTYFLLNAENYHWQWTSFFSAASTAIYVYLYSIYYYHVKTKMFGFFQISFYFGYTLMFCLGLGILCGKFLNPPFISLKLEIIIQAM